MVIKGPKGCLPAAHFPATAGRGAGDPQTCPKFRIWQMTYRIRLHGASDLDERCLKTHKSKDGCTFPPNIFVPTPKITPKRQFWGPFNGRPIILVASSTTPLSPKIKTLGVTIDQHLTLDNHVNTVCRMLTTISVLCAISALLLQ